MLRGGVLSLRTKRRPSTTSVSFAVASTPNSVSRCKLATRHSPLTTRHPFHRHLDSLILGEVGGLLVPGINVSHDSDPGIVGQHTFNALGHSVRAIRNGHLARVLRIANAHAASVVNRHP